MNPYSTLKEDIKTTTIDETVVSDFDTLTVYDFTAEQIVSLIEMRQRYQSGGSDRASVIRHWEFLRLLVASGRMEVSSILQVPYSKPIHTFLKRKDLI